MPFLPGGLEPDTLALDLDEDDDDEEVVGWRGKAPGLRRGLVFEDKDEGEEDDDWVIEAFLGRGKGDEVRRLKEELEGNQVRLFHYSTAIERKLYLSLRLVVSLGLAAVQRF